MDIMKSQSQAGMPLIIEGSEMIEAIENDNRNIVNKYHPFTLLEVWE